jgi:hypothetical protein
MAFFVTPSAEELHVRCRRSLKTLIFLQSLSNRKSSVLMTTSEPPRFLRCGLPSGVLQVNLAPVEVQLTRFRHSAKARNGGCFTDEKPCQLGEKVHGAEAP